MDQGYQTFDGIHAWRRSKSLRQSLKEEAQYVVASMLALSKLCDKSMCLYLFITSYCKVLYSGLSKSSHRTVP